MADFVRFVVADSLYLLVMGLILIGPGWLYAFITWRMVWFLRLMRQMDDQDIRIMVRRGGSDFRSARRNVAPYVKEKS